MRPIAKRLSVFSLFLVPAFFLLSLTGSDTTGGATIAYGQAASAASPAARRSIRDWVRCDGKDEDAGVAAAFAAAKDKAFTLVVDCHVVVHVGMDIRHTIFIDNGTTVQFTENGLFTVDNSLIPAFVIANSANIHLLGWRILYLGGIPVDWNTGGYYDNGTFIKKDGYDRPAFAFNDIALTQWLVAHRGIHFTQVSSPWAGPTDTTAMFYIVGSTNNLEIRDFKAYVPANAKGSQFIPMVFASIPGYKDNESVTRQTPVTAETIAVPNSITFSTITLDGYYMGWQGRFQTTLFEHVRAYRYGDLQDANGGNVGGVGKWFAPPHLIYLNYDPKQTGLENRKIQILDVIDYGQRVGVARDRQSEKGSGYVNSLKIGAVDSVVDGYKSYRPDGLLDLLPSTNLRISNVDATYDSSFLNNLYPAIRLPGPPYHHVTLENIHIVDKAAASNQNPVWGSNDGSNTQVVMKGIHVSLNNSSQPGKSPRAVNQICPHIAGSNNSVDLQVTVNGKTQQCP